MATDQNTDNQIVNNIAACMKLQNEFNSKVNVNWKRANYNWPRAMWIESAELMDHLGYKWWKNTDVPVDKRQVLLEVVDIFHFMLSGSMVNSRSAADLASFFKWAKRHASILPKEKQLKQVEEFAMLCIEQSSNIESAFFQLLVSLDISITDLTRYYLGKNALNAFRQNNGYKQNTYMKTWFMPDDSEVEDNKALENILDNSPDAITYDNIYDALSHQYEYSQSRKVTS